MSNQEIFLCILSAVAACFGLVNLIQFILYRNRTVQTVGTVIAVKMPNPETDRVHNSKWATLSYKVDGRIYQSHNSIQVPMASRIGSTVKVRYDKSEPEKLYSFSVFRIVVAFVIAVVGLGLAMLK